MQFVLLLIINLAPGEIAAAEPQLGCCAPLQGRRAPQLFATPAQNVRSTAIQYKRVELNEDGPVPLKPNPNPNEPIPNPNPNSAQITKP